MSQISASTTSKERSAYLKESRQITHLQLSCALWRFQDRRIGILQVLVGLVPPSSVSREVVSLGVGHGRCYYYHAEQRQGLASFAGRNSGHLIAVGGQLLPCVNFVLVPSSRHSRTSLGGVGGEKLREGMIAPRILKTTVLFRTRLERWRLRGVLQGNLHEVMRNYRTRYASKLRTSKIPVVLRWQWPLAKRCRHRRCRCKCQSHLQVRPRPR